MEKKTAALLGAIAGLATMGAAHAAIPPTPNAADALQVNSYADLLNPVDNASALLKADDIMHMQQTDLKAQMQLVDDYGTARRDHHHHHQAYDQRDYHHHQQAYYQRPRYDHHHHHHHHQQQGSYIGIPGVGGVEIGGR